MDEDNVIQDNLGLVYAQLKKFKMTDDPEAISIGYEALYVAVHTFDQTKNVTLSTYATVCIYNALGSYLRTLKRVKQLPVISYNVCVVDDDGNTKELLDCIPAAGSIIEDFIHKETMNCLHCAAERALAAMTNPNYIKIIKIWQDSEYSKPTTLIAKEAKVSQSYVSQVLSRFKSQVKKQMEAYQ